MAMNFPRVERVTATYPNAGRFGFLYRQSVHDIAAFHRTDASNGLTGDGLPETDHG